MLCSQIRISCKPQLAHIILAEEGLKEALRGKLLVSILAGVTISQITDWVLPTTKVIRAMPNTPCKVNKFTTFMWNPILKIHYRSVRA